MLNSGPMIDTGGNMAMASAPDSTSVLPGKSSRTIAYAANIARTTASTVAISAMPIELHQRRLELVVLEDVPVVVEASGRSAGTCRR